MKHSSTIQVTGTDQRPLVLVDIDGVLNAFEARRLTTHQRVAVADRYRVVLDGRHPGWFDVLGDYAELCWATMWQAKAGPVFGRVAGLGTDWEYLDFDSAWNTGSARRTGHGVGGYKWPMIEPLGDGARPLVWIDDDMTDEQLEWARVTERRRSAHTLRPTRPGGRLRRRAVRPGADLRPGACPPVPAAGFSRSTRGLSPGATRLTDSVRLQPLVRVQRTAGRPVVGLVPPQHPPGRLPARAGQIGRLDHSGGRAAGQEHQPHPHLGRRRASCGMSSTTGVSARCSLITLRLSGLSTAKVKSLLRGQVAVVALNSDGVPVAGAGLQIPGVLDDVYASAGHQDARADLEEVPPHPARCGPRPRSRSSVHVYTAGSNSAAVGHRPPGPLGQRRLVCPRPGVVEEPLLPVRREGVRARDRQGRDQPGHRPVQRRAFRATPTAA